MNFDNLQHTYSENIYNKRILNIGIEPPPFGGISVHMSRVSKKLLNQNNNVKILDVIKKYQKRNRLRYLIFFLKELFLFKPNLVFYHTLSLRKYPFELIILVFLKFFIRYEIVIINHTPRFFYTKKWLYKKIFNSLMHFVDKNILIGSSTYQALVENGFLLKNFNVESPFLMPDLTQDTNIFSQYPITLINFFNEYKKIILINGSQMKIWNNFDLYGYDMAINLIDNLKFEFPQVGLIIAVSSIGDGFYFNYINSLISSKKNIYLFYENNLELWPLIKRSNILVRPTVNDSYAISVAEAIKFNVPAIASDVCSRPQGTITFKSRNQEDFHFKVNNILKTIF